MTDALDRLRQRSSRPRVPERDTSLRAGSSTPSDKPERDTEKATLRLEKSLMQEMRSICQSSSISREDLIESMLEVFLTDPQEWQSILVSAKSKADLRLQIANRKRAESMIQRFS